MPESKTTTQMEIDFQKQKSGNVFRDRLNKGSFYVLIEAATPEKKEDFAIAAQRLKAVEASLGKYDTLGTGLAITDKTHGSNTWNIADFANELSKDDRDCHVLYISGRNATANDIVDTVARCRSSGFQNVVPVTGDAYFPEGYRKKHKLNFVDSVCTLNTLKSGGDKDFFFAGCTANPFKYTPADLFPQYYKMVKKIKQGAEFIVTQSGWDMMKLQELRWYLEMRELHFPSIARFTLLTTELFEEIFAGKRPGIHISAELRKILLNEAKYGYAQFASAQWRRLQIYAAGAKFLGYTGIQISGVERQEHIATACSKVAEAMREFKSFEDWRDGYLSYLSRADMTPYPYRHFMFNNLFTKAYPELATMKKVDLPECGKYEKLHYRMCKLLFSKAHRHSSNEHLLSKKIFTGCRKCSSCRLPFTQFVCPETCPKGLANGPCGGTRADGTCEFGGKQCIHAKIFRRASWLKDLDSLEERYIKPVEKI
ncbi:MAG TPA: hypothetical protein DET40_14400 [Lentisphaeria bacterium]|nr:MAG: hypothetical protein A2X45_05575 [Lentisphaerae bacterium GWF2_50_93]HCE44729.1 hypothetical protein [Lentisphaeria bacterium]